MATPVAPAEVCQVTRVMPEPEAATPASVMVAVETVVTAGAGLRMEIESGRFEVEFAAVRRVTLTDAEALCCAPS